MSQITMTGQCQFCSWGDRNVFHDVPWCPKVPALCHVDWNAARVENDECVHTMLSRRSFSRPVLPGEIVVLWCNDGDYMATWGLVEERGEHSERGHLVQVREIAHPGPWPTISYADDPAAAPPNTQEAGNG